MPILYIITGPAGVGKSTISRELANNKNKSALVEGDEIYHQVIGGYTQAWKDNNHLETFWKVCANMIRIYLEDEFDVIFNYIVTPKDIEYLRSTFKDYIIKFVVLMADEITLLARDSGRPVDVQMKERCTELLESFKSKKYDTNYMLDTSHMTIDQTVRIIETDNRFIMWE